MLSAIKDNKDNISVEIAPEAMEIPWVRDVWLNDKNPNKPFFNKVITWVYHVYSRDHVLSGLSLSERKKNVIDIYFDGKAPRSGKDNIEHNKRVQAFIQGYNKLTKTMTERIVETMDEVMYRESERIEMLNVDEKVKVKIPYDFTVQLENLYEKKNDKFIKVPAQRIAGESEQHITLYDSGVLSKMVSSMFTLIKSYEEAKAKALKERKELDREFNGESWLERYYRLEKERKV